MLNDGNVKSIPTPGSFNFLWMEINPDFIRKNVATLPHSNVLDVNVDARIKHQFRLTKKLMSSIVSLLRRGQEDAAAMQNVSIMAQVVPINVNMSEQHDDGTGEISSSKRDESRRFAGNAQGACAGDMQM